MVWRCSTASCTLWEAAAPAISSSAPVERERYDPTENAWEAVAPMAAARYAHAVAVLDGKLYAVGGFNNGFLSSVERYNPALDVRVGGGDADGGGAV